MKTHAAVLCLLSFAAGAAAVVAWPAEASGQRDGVSALPKATAEKAKATRPGAPGAASPAEGDQALTGLAKPPTMDEVLGASGLEQNLRMAVWLQTASSAEMAEMLDRCRDAEIQDLSLTDAVWLRWTEVDREAALRRKPSEAVWWALAKVDPDAAVEAALKESPGALREVIRSIGQCDHGKALELLAKYPRADSRLAWEGIIGDLRDEDLPGAAALALEKGAELKETVQAWVERDPDAALAWAKGQEDPAKRRRVMELALEHLRAADPAAALWKAGEMPPGRARSEHLAKAMTALIASERADPADTAHLMALVKKAPHPADRTRAYAEIAAGLAATSPEGALGAFRELAAEGWPKPEDGQWSYRSADEPVTGASGENAAAAATALEQLMAAEPRETAEILAALPDPRSAPVQRAISQWADQDPAVVSGWLEKQPAGAFKDEAVSGLTNWLLHHSPEPDPEAAAAWSLAASPERQAALLESSFLQWHGEDPAAARAGAERLPLTPEQRDTLRQQLDIWDQNLK